MKFVQQQYLQAKAHYDELYKQLEQKQKEIPEPSTDEEIEPWSEAVTHIEFELGIPEASKAYRQAEKDLISWGTEYIHEKLSDQMIPEYQECLNLIAQNKLIHMRQKACDLMLKL